MKFAVAALLVVSSAALLGGCATYPDNPGRRRLFVCLRRSRLRRRTAIWSAARRGFRWRLLLWTGTARLLGRRSRLASPAPGRLARRTAAWRMAWRSAPGGGHGGPPLLRAVDRLRKPVVVAVSCRRRSAAYGCVVPLGAPDHRPARPLSCAMRDAASAEMGALRLVQLTERAADRRRHIARARPSRAERQTRDRVFLWPPMRSSTRTASFVNNA